MKQTLKTSALALVLFLLFIMVYKIFSVTGLPSTEGATLSQGEEAPYWVSLLISWLPMLVMFVFYILFLQVFKKLLTIGERIAAALEVNGLDQQVSIEDS